MRFILYFFITCFSLTSADLHDVHISKAEIHYKSKERSVQISLHIFLDDLEDELELIGGKDLFLCTERETESAEEFLMSYIKKHFVLTQNSKPLNFQFVGKEVSEDLIAVWTYLLIEDVEQIPLMLDNQIMLSRFDDQKNIVSFKIDGKREGFFIMDHRDYSEKLM